MGHMNAPYTVAFFMEEKGSLFTPVLQFKVF